MTSLRTLGLKAYCASLNVCRGERAQFVFCHLLLLQFIMRRSPRQVNSYALLRVFGKSNYYKQGGKGYFEECKLYWKWRKVPCHAAGERDTVVTPSW